MSTTESKVIESNTATVAKRVSRSPVIAQFRLNPFRVLRVPVSTAIDEAIWRSEELLTRMRAGIPDTTADLIPWLPEPDEHEIRQAVQRIEEPLRRLVDELFWFDLDNDPHAEPLRAALSQLDVAELNRALDAEAGTDPAAALNQANFRLMLASLALVNALPAGVGHPLEASLKAAVVLPWKHESGLEIVEDPHVLDLTDGQLATRLGVCRTLWTDALSRWVHLLKSPEVATLIAARANRLEDDSVSEDDVEAILTAAESRLTDLVAAEIKGQLLANRPERVAILIEAAQTSGLDPKRWIFALRTLRPLFRSEAAELEPLLGDSESPRLDDIKLYLDRVEALESRWSALDRPGFLGLAEVADEAVVTAYNRIHPHENYGAITRLKALLERASTLATADSIKHRIGAAVARLEGLAKYACHFCKANEMDVKVSVVLDCKKESHRTYGFNSTIIHYLVTKDIVQRCPRCAEVHQYLNHVAFGTRIVLGIVAIALTIRLMQIDPQTAFTVAILMGLASTVVLWIAGMLARWIASLVVTPQGERRYRDIRTAPQYRKLNNDGFGITVDYSKNAFNKHLQGSGG